MHRELHKLDLQMLGKFRHCMDLACPLGQAPEWLPLGCGLWAGTRSATLASLTQEGSLLQSLGEEATWGPQRATSASSAGQCPSQGHGGHLPASPCCLRFSAQWFSLQCARAAPSAGPLSRARAGALPRRAFRAYSPSPQGGHTAGEAGMAYGCLQHPARLLALL